MISALAAAGVLLFRARRTFAVPVEMHGDAARKAYEHLIVSGAIGEADIAEVALDYTKRKMSSKLVIHADAGQQSEGIRG